MRVFLVGFPKSGTSSIQTAFLRSGLKSAHWQTRGTFVGQKMYECLLAGQDPLAYFSQFDAITQSDVCLPGRKINHWPQLDFAMLQAIRRHHPDCTFLLNWRQPADTARSISKWGHLQTRITKSDIPGLPAGFGGRHEELVTWIENHYAALRAFLRDDPRFVEIDIAGPDVQHRLSEIVGVPIRWWGRRNVGTTALEAAQKRRAAATAASSEAANE